MKRQEFTKATKLAAWERCGGSCECGCGQNILGTPEYDHIVAAALGGSNGLENCRVMSRKCHRRLTSAETVPTVAKATRGFEKRIGARRTRGFRRVAGCRYDWSQGRYIKG
jgi:5-methylcytosine-specific restriction endonuclease McrA